MSKKDLIKARLKDLGITQKEAAAKLGITPQALGNYIKEERNFGRNMAQKWSDAFGFSVSWLLSGEGEMLKSQQTSGHVVLNVGDIVDTEGDGNIVKSQVGGGAELASLRAEIKHLKEMLAEKERTIRLLEKMMETGR